MSINEKKAQQAVREIQEAIESANGAVTVKKIKGLKKVSIDDLYFAQSYAEATMLGRDEILEKPTDSVRKILQKFNVSVAVA